MNRRDFLITVGAAALVQTVRSDYDYIVIGAGSSGCVVVNRLTADPKVRVLLIEAGGPTSGDATVNTPGKWTSLIGSSFDWGYATEPQAGLQNRAITFPRGKGFGGSSAINAMAFIRGHRFCYDGWEALGNKGWGYDSVLPLFKRSERNESGESEFRGGSGPLAVSYCTDPHASHRAFLAAAWQNGFKADARYDFNEPAPNHTAGYYQKNILDGKRHSAADAFLAPALSRPNLVVHSLSQASKLMIENRTVVGVEYIRDGKPQTARATREVVVCSGVVDTPKLLMLSGIGPADHLKSVGVPVVLDVPGVGQNLQDHLKLSIRWNGKTTLPGSTVTAGMFARSQPSNAGTPPDLQFYVGRGLETPDRFVTITVALVQPRSRGEIRLRSADPKAPPIIQPNYLHEQADVDALVRGMKLARYFGEADNYEPLLADETEPGPAAKSDAELATFARRAADTIYHPAGTCKMGPDGDRTAVVDPQLRVRGLQGLRIADASIMPEVVNATTHAACVMIGEKAADLLKT
jgi:choline dehydrogenase